MAKTTPTREVLPRLRHSPRTCCSPCRGTQAHHGPLHGHRRLDGEGRADGSGGRSSPAGAVPASDPSSKRFGGTVEKFIGDAVVALFGAPVAHEDDPERAVKAALAICSAIDDLNATDEWLDLQVRIGVNTGGALIVVGAKSSEGEGMAPAEKYDGVFRS